MLNQELISGILLFNMKDKEMFEFFNEEYGYDLKWSEFKDLYKLVKRAVS